MLLTEVLIVSSVRLECTVDVHLIEEDDEPTELDVGRAEVAACKAETEAAEAVAEAILALLDSAQNDLNTANVKIFELQKQLNMSQISLQRFLADDDSIKFYTGFPSHNHLHRVFEMLQPSAERKSYIYSAGLDSPQSRPSVGTMVLIDEFLFLVRVRVDRLA